MRPCFFRTFAKSACVFRADGNPDPCHLIPKQRLRLAGITDRDLIWDKRNIVPGCRFHHSQFDMKSLRLGLGDYPRELFDFATDHGFFWAGERDGWVAEYRDVNPYVVPHGLTDEQRDTWEAA